MHFTQKYWYKNLKISDYLLMKFNKNLLAALDLMENFYFLNVSESMVPAQILKFVETKKSGQIRVGIVVEIMEIMFENNLY